MQLVMDVVEFGRGALRPRFRIIGAAVRKIPLAGLPHLQVTGIIALKVGCTFAASHHKKSNPLETQSCFQDRN